jgi:hypothetical protein
MKKIKELIFFLGLIIAALGFDSLNNENHGRVSAKSSIFVSFYGVFEMLFGREPWSIISIVLGFLLMAWSVNSWFLEKIKKIEIFKFNRMKNNQNSSKKKPNIRRRKSGNIK